MPFFKDPQKTKVFRGSGYIPRIWKVFQTWSHAGLMAKSEWPYLLSWPESSVEAGSRMPGQFDDFRHRIEIAVWIFNWSIKIHSQGIDLKNHCIRPEILKPFYLLQRHLAQSVALAPSKLRSYGRQHDHQPPWLGRDMGRGWLHSPNSSNYWADRAMAKSRSGWNPQYESCLILSLPLNKGCPTHDIGSLQHSCYWMLIIVRIIPSNSKQTGVWTLF